MTTDIDFAMKQMLNSQSTAWKIVSLSNLSQTYAFLNRSPTQITPNDRLLRDVYFANRLNVPSNPTEPSFVQYARDAYKDRKQKQFALEKKQDEDKYIKRALFWKHLFWFNPKTREESESKRIVRKTAVQVAAPSIMGFLVAALALYKLTGISKMSARVQSKGFFIFTFGGVYWTYFRLSDRVFKKIPPLPDGHLEMERRHLVAESVVTEALFVEPMDRFDKQLEDVNIIALGPEEKEIRKVLIENEGFRVFD